MSDDQRPSVPGHRLDRVLGEGASGVVWAGVDASGRAVAVKVPRVVSSVPATPVERQALVAVRHEHLVTLRTVVPMPDGREALVFDLVRGVPLRAMVQARGHLRVGEIITVLTPVCAAVAAIHAAGVVHGDLAPANIIITPDGRPMLLDLGSAHIAGRDAEEVHGTAGYVAREVRDGGRPSEASDVYALGALAWFCATGNGAPDTMLRLDPDVVESHVGPELAELIGACIDPDPERRPNSAALARRFYDAAAALPVEVVMGADNASALTHRLRVQARDEQATLTSRSRRHGFPRLLTGRLPRSAPPRRTARPERWAGSAQWRRAGAALVAAGVVVVAGAAWALAAWSGVAVEGAGGGRPSDTTPSSVAPSRATSPAATATSAPPRPSTSRASVDVAGRVPTETAVPTAILGSPRAPALDAEGVLAALSDARARALTDRDLDALAGVDRVGSPSWAADRQLLQTLLQSGTRWVGLRLEVAEATHVTSSATTATIRGRVDWTSYTLVEADGTRVRQPAERGRQLDFQLVRTGSGWRLEAIRQAPAS